jgi:spore germination cell wall hydrolase CwlJ-like protein
MSDASEDSETVGRLYDYTLVYVDEAGSEWTQISSGNVTGYVKNASLCFGEEAEVVFNESAEEERELNDGYTLEEAEEKEAQEEAERIAEEEAKRQEEENARIQQAMQNTGVSYNPTMSASDEEVWLIAAIVEWEAGGESYQGKLAVANVILNRVRSSAYPDSITGVIYAPKQFSGVTDGNGNLTSKFAARLEKGPATECLEAAMEALSGVNNVGSYTSFRSVSIANYSSYNSYMIIGGHCFY